MQNTYFSSVPGIQWPAFPAPAGARFVSLLAQLEATQWWHPERLRAAQLGQIETLVRHAFANTSFYRRHYAGFDPRAPLTWERFEQLPVLRRVDLQQQREEILSRADLGHHGARIDGYTSGSTGTPIHSTATGLSITMYQALSLRELLWHRIDLGATHAVIRAKIEGRDTLGWGGVADAVFLTGKGVRLGIEQPLEVQVQWLRRKNPAYVLTYPSNLAALARLCAKQGIRLPRLRAARTFGEAVSDDLAQLCREAWDVPLIDGYSAREIGTIALQCPDQPLYHAQSESVLIEILDDRGNPCRAGDTGRVVLTALHNFAQPLIRYEIGDHAVAAAPCPCGRGLPAIARILGRTRNLVVLPNGTRHWPFLSARSIAPIRQFRLIQRDRKRVEAQYVIDRALTSDETARVARSFQECLGYPFEIDFVRCEEIARGEGGKFEDFICEVRD